jgi:predicted CXXCH cytochrome family protein
MWKIFGVTFALTVAAQLAAAQLKHSVHDFSAQGWGETEICRPCHSTQNGSVSLPAVPWDSEPSSRAYTVYASPTLDALTGQPTGVSKACLSCHDGTVAPDSFAGSVRTTALTGRANLGTDLSNDHPVSFTYDDALAAVDGELHSPSIQSSGLGGTIASDLLFGSGNTRLECASCHDVHNTSNQEFLLVKSNEASALCLTCHSK